MQFPARGHASPSTDPNGWAAALVGNRSLKPCDQVPWLSFARNAWVWLALSTYCPPATQLPPLVQAVARRVTLGGDAASGGGSTSLARGNSGVNAYAAVAGSTARAMPAARTAASAGRRG